METLIPSTATLDTLPREMLLQRVLPRGILPRGIQLREILPRRVRPGLAVGTSLLCRLLLPGVPSTLRSALSGQV